MKKKWYEYLWIAEILYWVLGLTNILFAWLGLVFFAAPLMVAFIGGNKAYCNRYCGRGQLFGMLHEYSRMELLIGEEAMEFLEKSRVAVFGIGGVGSYVVEALARCGVGGLTLVDNDVVSLTNINRQLLALHSTVGKA